MLTTATTAQDQTTSTHKANPPPSRKPQTHNNLINSCPQNLDQPKFCVDLKKFDYLTFHFFKPKKSTNRLPKVHGYSSTSVIFTSGPLLNAILCHFSFCIIFTPSNSFFEIENAPCGNDIYIYIYIYIGIQDTAFLHFTKKRIIITSVFGALQLILSLYKNYNKYIFACL